MDIIWSHIEKVIGEGDATTGIIVSKALGDSPYNGPIQIRKSQGKPHPTNGRPDPQKLHECRPNIGVRQCVYATGVARLRGSRSEFEEKVRNEGRRTPTDKQ
jgi:hypothetical protein